MSARRRAGAALRARTRCSPVTTTCPAPGEMCTCWAHGGTAAQASASPFTENDARVHEGAAAAALGGGASSTTTTPVQLTATDSTARPSASAAEGEEAGRSRGGRANAGRPSAAAGMRMVGSECRKRPERTSCSKHAPSALPDATMSAGQGGEHALTARTHTCPRATHAGLHIRPRRLWPMCGPAAPTRARWTGSP